MKSVSTQTLPMTVSAAGALPDPSYVARLQTAGISRQVSEAVGNLTQEEFEQCYRNSYLRILAIREKREALELELLERKADKEKQS